MKVSVIGTGYVGLVTAVCLAQVGRKVMCQDIDKSKIRSLRKGVSPIYEAGLNEMLESLMENKSIDFTHSPKKTVEFADVIFICVGTPSNEDGSVNMDYVKSVCDAIAEHQNGPKVVVMKSTVPVGSHAKIREWLPRGCYLVSNPEFLREGVAIQDFLEPDRIVIGLERDAEVEETMKSVYDGINGPIFFTDNASAEMTKYVSNAMLATRIAFINEIAELCDKTGANVLHVKEMVGEDTRIGPKFLEPGPGYGGSCFPKDTRGLLDTFEAHEVDGTIVDAVIKSNEAHKGYVIRKLEANGFDFKNKKVAVLGLAFKPNTDDTRESPTHKILRMLKKRGAITVVHDPVAKPANERLEDVVLGVDVILVVTEWDCYKGLDAWTLRKLVGKNQAIIVDARNIWRRKDIEDAGFTYFGMGR